MSYKIAIIVWQPSRRAASTAGSRARSAPSAVTISICSMIEIGDLPLYNQDYDALARAAEAYVRFRDQIRPADGILLSARI